MTPDHLALLTVTGIGKSIAHSALPNAPVVDDSNDRPSLAAQLAAVRMRLAALVRPGGPTTAVSLPDAAVEGC